MSVSEIRTIKDDEAIFVYANKKPLKLNIKAYYKDFMYKTFSNITPYRIKNSLHNDKVFYVDLKNVEW